MTLLLHNITASLGLSSKDLIDNEQTIASFQIAKHNASCPKYRHYSLIDTQHANFLSRNGLVAG